MADALPKVPLGKMKCPCCGALAVVTQTKTGGGFLMCQMPLADGWCATRVTLSRHGVAKMLGKVTRPAAPEETANLNRPPVANDNAAPAAPQQKGGSDANFLGF